ncbi:Putative callose synthase 8 [Zea mays]|uniref:Putative callose synthase 8 n=1 Tax=Zea mays TaxID=4577 RepID=A0A1D6NT06_MAIZE|nr:Putative callose synthase 8 [Zea mays]
MSPLFINVSGHIEDWDQIRLARAEGRLFNKLKWPNDPKLKDLIKRLYSLLTIKESAATVPKNLEARRRLQFFTNSLFMEMPVARPVSEMVSFIWGSFSLFACSFSCGLATSLLVAI